ncbi:MAG: DUF6164 family protein [Methyloprofundus sp.]|nr:DUF6164 family protein [Methyloprofundus sp.]
MALLLFPLRNVPDDEAEDIRDVLTENSIAFYETKAGNWGISMPAIWLSDESQLEQARTAINTYQEERKNYLQNEYNKLKESGQENTFLKNLWYRPVSTLLILAAITLVFYLSIKLVFDFAA